MRLLSEVYKLSNVVNKPNLIVNGDFATNISGWVAYVNGGSNTLPLFVWESGKARITPQGTYANTGIASQNGFSLQAGKNYRLTWKARSVSNTTMNIYVETPDNQSSSNIFNVTSTEQTFTFNFANTTTINTAKVYLRTAEIIATNTDLYLDDVVLVEV